MVTRILRPGLIGLLLALATAGPAYAAPPPPDGPVTDTNELMARSLRRADFKEGVASFVEKRLPNFAGVTRSNVSDL